MGSDDKPSDLTSAKTEKKTKRPAEGKERPRLEDTDMSGKDRINVFPSRGAQTNMKLRLKGAQKGHSLLKKKADALQMKFRLVLQSLTSLKGRSSSGSKRSRTRKRKSRRRKRRERQSGRPNWAWMRMMVTMGAPPTSWTRATTRTSSSNS